MEWMLTGAALVLGTLWVLPEGCVCQCNPGLCSLPDCYCPGTQRPPQLAWEDTPQMLMLTFDDAVLKEHTPVYKRLFRTERVNPNGCPIQATFFVCHNWTDYNMVGELYKAGHEMASHTKTHRMPQSWWTYASYGDWENELEGQRDNLEKLAGVKRGDMRGARVPYLETGGDAQFQMMTDTGYLYDSSFMTGPFTEGGVWPFTLHYPPTTTYCSNNNCPKKSYPSIWEIPLNRWVGLDGRACPMMDSCDRQPKNKEETKTFLRKNFDRHYHGNRAPLGMHLHATWFNGGGEFKLDALEEFLDEVLDKKDVYLVSMYQVLTWMLQPQSSLDAPQFKHWRTSCKDKYGNKPSMVTSQRKPVQSKIQKLELARMGKKDDTQNPERVSTGRPQSKNMQKVDRPGMRGEQLEVMQDITEVPAVTSQVTRAQMRPFVPPKEFNPKPRLPYFTRPKVNYTPIPSGLDAFPQPGRRLYNSADQPVSAGNPPVIQNYPTIDRINSADPHTNQRDMNAKDKANTYNKVEFEVDAKIMGSESLTNQELDIRTEQRSSPRDKKGFRVKIDGDEVEVIATNQDGRKSKENVAGTRQSQAAEGTSAAQTIHILTKTVLCMAMAALIGAHS